jgi:hypothetical protein
MRKGKPKWLRIEWTAMAVGRRRSGDCPAFVANHLSAASSLTHC